MYSLFTQLKVDRCVRESFRCVTPPSFLLWPVGDGALTRHVQLPPPTVYPSSIPYKSFRDEASTLAPLAHTLTSQATPLSKFKAFTADVAFKQGAKRYPGSWGLEIQTKLGESAGCPTWQHKLRNANNSPSRLEAFDRFGHRQDVGAFQDNYHAPMKSGLDAGTALFAWQDSHRSKPGAHVIRGGGDEPYLSAQSWDLLPRHHEFFCLTCSRGRHVRRRLAHLRRPSRQASNARVRWP